MPAVVTNAKPATVWYAIGDFWRSYEGMVILQRRDGQYVFVTHLELEIEHDKQHEDQVMSEYVAWAPLTPAPQTLVDEYEKCVREKREDEELADMECFGDVLSMAGKGAPGLDWQTVLEHPHYKRQTSEETLQTLETLYYSGGLPQAHYKRLKQNAIQARYRARAKAKKEASK